MSENPKRPRGRPPKLDQTVPISFSMQKELADYLIYVGKRFGWGTEINEVVRSILIAEVRDLQKTDFHDKVLPNSKAESSDA